MDLKQMQQRAMAMGNKQPDACPNCGALEWIPMHNLVYLSQIECGEKGGMLVPSQPIWRCVSCSDIHPRIRDLLVVKELPEEGKADEKKS